MNAGDLNRPIRLERDEVTRVDGARSQETPTPKPLGEAWAAFDFGAGRDVYRAQQKDSSVNCAVKLRSEWADTVRPGDRVLFGPWRMEIKWIAPDEKDPDALLLMCEAKRG